MKTEIAHIGDGDALADLRVLAMKESLINHLYVHPNHQGMSIGSTVLKSIIETGRRINKHIKLGALKGRRSNQFYRSHGFVKVAEGEYDNYYELRCH